QGTGYRCYATGTGDRLQVTGDRLQVTGDREQGTGNREQVTGATPRGQVTGYRLQGTELIPTESCMARPRKLSKIKYYSCINLDFINYP
ncbi:MAG: hypothetical protein RLZZ86_2386, partial [Cyanobacteriota bacterium]